MATLEHRIAKLEESVPDSTGLRATLEGLRRFRTTGRWTAEDAANLKASLNERTLERQLRGLTDDELREGIELLNGIPIPDAMEPNHG